MGPRYRVMLVVPCDSAEQARGMKIQLDRALEDAFQDGEIDEEIESTIEELPS